MATKKLCNLNEDEHIIYNELQNRILFFYLFCIRLEFSICKWVQSACNIHSLWYLGETRIVLLEWHTKKSSQHSIVFPIIHTL